MVNSTGSGPPIVVKRWSQMTPDEVFDMVVLRTEVYYVEQRIDEQDFDAADRDERTLHLWIPDGDGIAAYLRVVELDAQEHGALRTFGRVVVRVGRRREGLSRRLIAHVMEQFGDEAMVIHAQSYVVGLYEDFGFTVVGEPFVEAGLPHLTMVRPVSPPLARRGPER